MVWEYEIPTILMLTQCTQEGKVCVICSLNAALYLGNPQIKCFQYWPEKLHESLTVKDKFRVTFSSNTPFAEYEFRKFKLENVSVFGYVPSVL